MSPVARFELVLLLLAIIIVLELAARRLRLPPAAAFVLGGIALALIPETPQAELDPDLALVLFLPPLLLSSAFFTVWRDFRANLRIILQLAVGAVAFTTLIVGLVAHLVRRSLTTPSIGDPRPRRYTSNAGRLHPFCQWLQHSAHSLFPRHCSVRGQFGRSAAVSDP